MFTHEQELLILHCYWETVGLKSKWENKKVQNIIKLRMKKDPCYNLRTMNTETIGIPRSCIFICGLSLFWKLVLEELSQVPKKVSRLAWNFIIIASVDMEISGSYVCLFLIHEYYPYKGRHLWKRNFVRNMESLCALSLQKLQENVRDFENDSAIHSMVLGHIPKRYFFIFFSVVGCGFCGYGKST